jgi:hypothetical protein
MRIANSDACYGGVVDPCVGKYNLCRDTYSDSPKGTMQQQPLVSNQFALTEHVLLVQCSWIRVASTREMMNSTLPTTTKPPQLWSL